MTSVPPVRKLLKEPDQEEEDDRERHGFHHLPSNPNGNRGKEARPETPEGEVGDLRERIEEVDVQEEHKGDDEPPHSLSPATSLATTSLTREKSAGHEEDDA